MPKRNRKRKAAEKLLKELTVELCVALGIEYDDKALNEMVAECSSSAKEELNLEEKDKR